MAREATDPRSSSARRRRKATASGKKEEVKPPSRREVLQVVAEYDYEMCRMLGHRWQPPNGSRPIEVVTIKRQGQTKHGLVAFPCYCPGCTTTRVDYINPRTGHLEQRKYELPDGYLLKGFGENRPSKDDWRREAVGRLVK